MSLNGPPQSHPRNLLVATLLLAGFAASSLAAQAPQSVPLRAFESEAQAEQFLVQQAENRLQQIARSARARGCNPTDRYVPDVDPCLGVAHSHAIFDDSDLMVRAASRQLLMLDSSLASVQPGSGMHLPGAELFVMRLGRLARVRLTGDSVPVSDVVATRLSGEGYDGWRHDWHDELHVWGDVVAVIAHNRGASFPALRTYIAQPDGPLTPRDTLLISGDPPVPLDNVASRMIGSHVYIYSAWPVRTGVDPISHLVPISHSTSDGDPDSDRPVGLSVRVQTVQPRPAFLHAYRPVAPFDSSALLDHVHALIDCDLDSVPLSCTATMVMAPRTSSFDFTSDALEVVAAESDTAMVLRMPYVTDEPTATMRMLTDTAVPERLSRIVALDSTVLELTPGRGVMRATLRSARDSSRVISDLILPDAGPASAVDVNFSNPVLTVQRMHEGQSHYRVAYTVIDRTAERSSNPYRANNAVWFFDVRGDTLSTLGLLRASPHVFADLDAEIMRQRMGATQAAIRGDRVFAVFNEELVQARVVNGQLEQVQRLTLFPK